MLIMTYTRTCPNIYNICSQACNYHRLNFYPQFTRNVNDRQFLEYINKIIEYNNIGVEFIWKDQYQLAMVYLAQAQRILQYGASCGKSIRRNLVIAILRNHACSYYALSDLLKASSYLQAVIFNIKNSSPSIQSSKTSSSVINQQINENDQFYKISTDRKIQLVHYHLQYCTLNSQAKRRDIALQAGLNVVKLVKSLLSGIMNQNVKIQTFEPQKKQQKEREQQQMNIKQVIKNHKFLTTQIDPCELQSYLSLTRSYIQKHNVQKLTCQPNILQCYIKDYSISQVIQILPYQYNGDDTNLLMNSKQLMKEMLHLSMGYFTISTEYRLLSEAHYPKDLSQKLNSQEWKKANIYHLFAILQLAFNFTSHLLFLKQLISSYQQHYKIQIFKNQNLSDQDIQKLSQKLLFCQLKPKIVKNNQLLHQNMNKLHKKQQRTISKLKKGSQNALSQRKLNITKQKVTQRRTKRSLSKQQVGIVTLSTKKSPYKIYKSSSNNHILKNVVNSSKQKLIQRKRSYSKDSVSSKKQIKQIFTKVHMLHNQYQIGTGNDKSNKNSKRKRTISSGKINTLLMKSQQINHNHQVRNNRQTNNNRQNHQISNNCQNRQISNNKNNQLSKNKYFCQNKKIYKMSYNAMRKGSKQIITSHITTRYKQKSQGKIDKTPNQKPKQKKTDKKQIKKVVKQQKLEKQPKQVKIKKKQQKQYYL